MDANQVQDIYELSPMQQGMFFHSLAAPAGGMYFEQFSCTLHGSLDRAAFQRAWQSATDRHAVLRTSLLWEELDKPVQIVHRTVTLPWEEYDWRDLSPEQQDAQLTQLRLERQARGFDLTQPPLMQLILIRSGEQTYRFIWNHHHLLLDGWSLAALFQEVIVAYNAYARGAQPRLAACRPYRDYILWLQRQNLAEAEAFWRGYLAGFDTPTPLLTRKAATWSEPSSHTYEQQTARVAPDVTRALNELATRAGVTLNTLVQGAWAASLSHYSGNDDVVFGVTSAGRPADLPGVESMVGLFINTLPLRVRVAADQPLRPWLQALQAQSFTLRQYEYSPLFQIQGWSETPRGVPLFESLLIFLNYPLDQSLAEQLDGVALRDLQVAERTNYPLTIFVEPGAQLRVSMSYDTERFDAETIARMLAHFEDLLAAMAGSLTQRLRDLPLLTTAEQAALARYNATDADYPRALCLHELIAAQAARTPDAVALVCEGASLTYGELDRRANQLAHELRRRGVGPQALVGICVERSSMMLVGLLGILKAGGAYLPLDPAFPPERLAYMLEDSGARVLLTDDEGRKTKDEGLMGAGGHGGPPLRPFGVGAGPRAGPGASLLAMVGGPSSVVDLVADWPTIALQPTTAPESGATPENLAYVLYTSGSTGRPKGVQIPHRAVVNFLESMRREPGLTAADRLLAVTTLSFDIAGLELYLPLVNGACVVLASRTVAADGPRLAGLLDEAGTTVMQATPSTWRLLLDAGWAGSARLKLLCGGEALPRDLANRLLGACGELWNVYGPTETTIWSSVAKVAPGDGSVPIGQPIANTQIYVLDRHLRRVPLGVPGELYIGGDGLAHGYLGRPDLTAERFVPNPFSDEERKTKDEGKLHLSFVFRPSSRLYRTGDLARYRPDGTLECLGRIDHQVKIRGFRIETGEIEAVLAQHPSVRESVVVAREDTPGDARLVVYLVPTTDDRRLTTDDCADTETGRQADQETRSAPTANRQLPTANRELPSVLREFLAARLPAYMVPSVFVTLDALPVTPNGKIDRKALPAPEGARPELADAYVSPRSDLERTIAEVWQAVLGVARVGIHDNFFDLGGHSLLLAQVHSRLRAALGRDLTMVDLLKHPTIGALARHLSPSQAEPLPQPGDERAQLRRELGGRADAVAIIAMTGRFPGARSVEQFWQNLRAGVESVTFFSEEELRAAGVEPELLANSSYVRANALLDDVELFDAGVFGMTPKEAEITDPQHRLFLECAWEALERAGYDSERYGGRIGVYAGVSLNTYLLRNITSNWNDLLQYAGFHQLFVGNDKDFVPTRVSYKLNLRGPSIDIQTACSTSLVAVHEACQSLLTGACDIALAGGAMVKVPQREGYLYQEGGIASPDGHCRAFDAQAGGTTRGDGVAVVMLKRLSDALRDGDLIHAVIRGSAVNNDGAQKVGYTAPSVDGQADVIGEALAIADVAPETIGYVEAHGTGTPLGDPIEIAALTQAYRAHTSKTGFCAVGSVKTNIGHLDTAAGAAGLIKAVLALQHQEIPPSLNYTRPNPAIDFANSPFYVNARLTPWMPRETPLRAAVSSFGIGGTNAHVILEQAPERTPSGPSRPWQLLTLSARTESALDAATDNLGAFLRDHPDLNLADVAFTLHTGRRVFEHRRAIVCRSLADAAQAIAQRSPTQLLAGLHTGQDRPVAFMFSGQGAQYIGMARGLYETEPTFRDTLDRCAEVLMPHLGRDIREILFDEGRRTKDEGQFDDGRRPKDEGQADDGRWMMDDGRRDELSPQSSVLDQTQYAQPALFAVEYALAQLWLHWGVRPSVLIGHSIGEYVAACLAGVFSLEDALALVAARGRLMQRLPTGAMLAVPLPEADVRPLLGDTLALAAVNAPALCVVSGPHAAIARLEQELAAQGVNGRLLHTSHAFHSPMMDPILAQFAELVGKVRLNAPKLPYISNLTGTWMTDSDALDPSYWARHLRGTVRFADGLAALLGHPRQVLLEVGPGQTLTTFARQHPARTDETVVLGSLRHPNDKQPDLAFALNTLARLWLAGAPVDSAALYADEQRRRVLLPTYPFERQRYWIEPKLQDAPRPRSTARRPDIADWFYLPSWKRAPLPASLQSGTSAEMQRVWLVFADRSGVGAALTERLRQNGQSVVQVSAGLQFSKAGEQHFTIRPNRREDYLALLDACGAPAQLPARIVHLWSVTPEPPADFEQTQRDGFYSLMLLAQALGERDVREPIHIAAVANRLYDVTGDEPIDPAKATLLGVTRVISQEYLHVSCQCIDISIPASNLTRLVDQLVAEASAPAPSPVVAYRGQHRWVQIFDPARLDSAPGGRLRPSGVYLITGGLGGIGGALAEHLARTVQARLVLVGRTALPQRADWSNWLATHDEQDATSRKIQQLSTLEALGAQVLPLSADVTDLAQMQRVVAQSLAHFGTINGVIHAAGLAGGGLLQLKTVETAERVLAPKTLGLPALDAALHDTPLDFLALFSSITAIIGEFGQADYCAANAFLDAFAHQRAQRTGQYTVSINWDRWHELGMSVSSGVPAELRELRANMTAHSIRPNEGCEVFDRILSANLPPQVIVSTRDLDATIAQVNAFTRERMQGVLEQPREARAAHARPALATPYVAPRTELEQTVARICQALLGVEPVGLHDNFFELGCDSLMAIQFAAQIKNTLGVHISTVTLFESPTISALVEHLKPKEDEKPALAESDTRAATRIELARRRRQVRQAE